LLCPLGQNWAREENTRTGQSEILTSLALLFKQIRIPARVGHAGHTIGYIQWIDDPLRPKALMGSECARPYPTNPESCTCRLR